MQKILFKSKEKNNIKYGKRYYGVIFACLLSLVFIKWGIQSNYKWLPYNMPYCLVYHISAYNFFKHNTLFTWYERDLCWKDGLIHSKVPNSGAVIGQHPVTETIGFAVIVGLLWKITGSPSIYHIQLLAIILFALSFLFLYEIAFLLFNSHIVALLTCISNLLFFPLTYTAIQGRNDIWTYFGIVLLLFIVAKHKKQTHFVGLFLWGIVIALLQWVRSALMFPVFGVIFLLIMLDFLTEKNGHYRSLIFGLFLSNILFFWAPFFIVNKIYYGRYFVGPLGLLLLVGLGEFPNKWGIVCKDSWVMDRISFSLGTVDFDDEAKALFFKFFKEDPLFFLSNIFRRCVNLLFWNFTWFDYDPALYNYSTHIIDKIKLLIASPVVLFDFIFRALYVRVYFLLGYCGIVLALMKKYYFEVLLLMTCMWSIPMVLLSHIEDRYVVVHFWIISFFVAFYLNQYFSQAKKSIRRGI